MKALAGVLVLVAGAVLSPGATLAQTHDAMLPPVSFPLSARGNEPFWALQLAEGQMTLSLMAGDAIAVALPAPEPADDGWRFDGGDGLVAQFSPLLCRDSMTGMPHPFSVIVEADGATLSGCGGDPVDLLVGADWSVTELQGEALAEDIPVTMAFEAEGRVAGGSGCNRYFGGFHLSGEGLSFDANMAGTMMACDDAKMAVERSFLDTLPTVTGFDIDPDGALVLLSGDDPVLRAVR